MNFPALWNRAFLEERSSIGLSLFRFAVAATVGFHVIPTLLELKDNYLSTAFKTLNPNFFTHEVLEWVSKSPDWAVYAFTYGFYVFWFFFLVGFRSQLSCILMTLTCYYFYALNAFHIGTLSWDILLVTVFLMCITNYHGDYFSVDYWVRAKRGKLPPKRPFFVQRLLQIQIALTYFYTAFYKISAAGNWLHDNPMYYLYNYPPEGVTKNFPFRSFLAEQPEICYLIGIAVIITELSMPFLLFIRRTRMFGILIGCFFQIMLVVTLHVPTIFFFLFTPQLFLFVDPEKIEKLLLGRGTVYRARFLKRAP